MGKDNVMPPDKELLCEEGLALDSLDIKHRKNVHLISGIERSEKT